MSKSVASPISSVSAQSLDNYPTSKQQGRRLIVSLRPCCIEAFRQEVREDLHRSRSADACSQAWIAVAAVVLKQRLLAPLGTTAGRDDV